MTGQVRTFLGAFSFWRVRGKTRTSARFQAANAPPEILSRPCAQREVPEFLICSAEDDWPASRTSCDIDSRDPRRASPVRTHPSESSRLRAYPRAAPQGLRPLVRP